MATYLHECQLENCKHQWEDEYSVFADPPELCPKCGEKSAKRLISFATPGKMELSADQIDAEIKKGGQEIANKAARNENYLANLVGDTKYQSNTVDRQEAKKYLNSEKKNWRRV